MHSNQYSVIVSLVPGLSGAAPAWQYKSLFGSTRTKIVRYKNS